MVRINTSNGYIISVIQSTRGGGMMMEALVWANNNPSGKTIDIKIKGVDMSFLDEDGLIKLIKKVKKLPKVEWV